MIMGSLSIDEVNELASDNFIKIFGNVVEHYHPAAIGILKNRPFRDPFDISDAINKYLDGLSNLEKVEILRLHPDLAGRLADLGKLTHDSTEEQKSAGLNNLTPEQKAELTKLNQQYRSTFGFPFIICAKEHKVDAIFAALKKRLNHDKDTEVEKALKEVKKISRRRILNIVN